MTTSAGLGLRWVDTWVDWLELMRPPTLGILCGCFTVHWAKQAKLAQEDHISKNCQQTNRPPPPSIDLASTSLDNGIEGYWKSKMGFGIMYPIGTFTHPNLELE